MQMFYVSRWRGSNNYLKQTAVVSKNDENKQIFSLSIGKGQIADAMVDKRWTGGV
jgi:hypothetical protein